MNRAIFAGMAVAAIALPAFAAVTSGLRAGDRVIPFHPTHVAGPDKGTDTCPPCKYGNRPAVQVWINSDTEKNVVATAQLLNKRVADSKSEFKAFMIKVTTCENCENFAKTAGKNKAFENVAMAYIGKDDSAIKDYKLNTGPEVKNTVFVYSKRTIVDTIVNFDASNRAHVNKLNAAITKAEATK
ncbi:MAG: hypothetical protein MUC92_02925 [Fimbriimonadaceae bacterium]|jgi:protocatechuate 3,4-dioxygenase beta subunit|nr:hypothetical protein [Fimbriimonadaceae bacterium]